MLIEVVIILLLVGIDQYVKFMVENGLEVRQGIEVISNFFYIYHVRNTGVAFSIFSGKVFIMAIVGGIAIIGMIIYCIRNYKKMDILTKGIVILFMAGAIGNTYDRIFRGFVVDFLDFRGIWNAIFNIADVYLTIGAGLLLLKYYLDSRKEKLAGGIDEK